MVESIGTPTSWALFVAVVAAILILDLAVFNRHAKAATPRSSAIWTAICISLAGLFAAWLFWEFGTRHGLEFVTGYLIEYALSVDNLFVFLVIFGYFGVPGQYQHRVLFWGILGALVLRAAFVLAGTALLTKFQWMLYLFGAFLLVTGVRLLFGFEAEVDPGKNPVLRFVRRFLPVTKEYHGQSFLVRIDGRLFATPLFMVLVTIEATDVVFAVDSIPAIFAITQDPFLVFTSNMFAILGLRALYFLLADFMDRFHYLKYGLGLVLAFVGAKMLMANWFHLPISISLGVIVVLLGGSVWASFLFPPAKGAESGSPVHVTGGDLPRRGQDAEK